jgi:predicted DsbA family dithiol-disulfide isomerase
LRTPFLAAALSLLLLAGCATRTAATPAPAPAPAEATGPEPTTPEELLPGIPLDGLSPEQQQAVAEIAREEFCYCGAPFTISQRLRQHGGCHHAKRQARLAARLAMAGLPKAEVRKSLLNYYASFDRPRRARLDLAGFGPPLGEPDAPVTLVEFSDFTCPYCQLMRPVLERFVAERKGRVKLHFKPFPIEAHPNAVEAAQAGEWARDQGIFWAFHDLMFQRPQFLAPDELAGYVSELGKDGASLRAALEAGTYRYKVEGSQAEARLAGLRGTPTLFFGGRIHLIPDFSEWMLEFTLQDEEEWQEQQGWSRDEGN